MFALTVYKRASVLAQMVKNVPAMWETWVQSLSWEDPLEKGMEICFSILPSLENLSGQRSLVDYSPWGCKELDRTERLSAAQA